jgi:hypothetical protein
MRVADFYGVADGSALSVITVCEKQPCEILDMWTLSSGGNDIIRFHGSAAGLGI